MKKDFFDFMFKKMQENKDIYLIFCGLGWPRIDEFLKAYPDRAFNFEASEQTVLDAAVGLAYENKIPFVYTITPFLLRGFETIRTYINREKLHCVLIGAGVGDEYSKTDGFSHEAGDIMDLLGMLENINQHYPDNKEELIKCIDEAIKIKEPHFVNIHK